MGIQLKGDSIRRLVLGIAAVTLISQPVVAADSQSANSRLARIQKDNLLKVCIWPDYYAITFRNPKTGQLSGIDIDQSQALAKSLGVTLQYVDSSFATLIDDLLTDKCDVSMHAIGITPQRSAKLAFTQPYLRSDIYAVTLKQHPRIKAWQDLDKTGNVIAVQGGTFMEPVMQDALKKAQLQRIVPPTVREKELEAGRIDAFMTDYPNSRRVIDQFDWANVLTAPTPFHPVNYAYAIKPDDAVWLQRLNTFIAQSKADGQLAASAKKHQLTPILLKD